MSKHLRKLCEECRVLWQINAGSPPLMMVLDRVHAMRAKECEDCRKKRRDDDAGIPRKG